MKGMMIGAFLMGLLTLTVVVPYISIRLVNATLRNDLITPNTRRALAVMAVAVLIIGSVVSQWN